MQADPLENNALDISALEGASMAAYKALSARIDAMPGELQSTRRWIPPVGYYLMAASLLALLGVLWLLWRLLRWLRR